MDLSDLHQQILKCEKCPLHQTRKHAVPGEGDPHADIIIIGEAPGRWEDLKGRPFVGRAGQLLDQVMDEVGLTRDQVFIANILKCRPPDNRRPKKEEVNQCSPYLQKQIQLINPKVLVPLGNTAGEWLFGKYKLEWPRITPANGQVYRVSTLMGPLKIIPAFHPAAVLRNPNRMPDLKRAFQQVVEHST